MSALFRNRRKPKLVGRDSADAEQNEASVTPVRPRSKLNKSLNLADDASDEDSSTGSVVHRPSKRKPVTVPPLPRTESASSLVERPSYSKDYLDELRNSTASTPKDLSVYNSEEDAQLAVLDITGKFGTSSTSTTTNAIPSAAEIREKKERRARLAKEHAADAEQDFIALEDYDSDGEFKPQRMQVGQLLDHDKEKDTRLVRDDEDIAEGFDEFVEDTGRVTLSKRGRREQRRQEREDIRNAIDEAEESGSDEDSDEEMNHAYTLHQTRRGMDGLSAHETIKTQLLKPQQPKSITPIPKISDVMNRLREKMQELEMQRVRLEKRRADIQREKAEVAAREEHIQNLLEEAGENFKKLMEDVRNVHDEQGDPDDAVTALAANSTAATIANGAAGHERGLESLGGTMHHPGWGYG